MMKLVERFTKILALLTRGQAAKLVTRSGAT